MSKFKKVKILKFKLEKPAPAKLVQFFQFLNWKNLFKFVKPIPNNI
jgi:hypothetical protein